MIRLLFSTWNILQRNKIDKKHVVYVHVNKTYATHSSLALTDVNWNKTRDSAFQQPKNNAMGIDHLPSSFTFLINPAQTCSFMKSTSESVILVGVESSPSHFDSRSAIRQTWANRNLLINHSTRVVFLVGIPESAEIQKELSRESLQYDDLVQGSFQEHYRNLTRKTIMFLRWSYYFCSSANFIIKTDDDVFVNLMNIIPQIRSLPKVDMYLGQQRGKRAPVIRNPKHKWYTSQDDFPDEYYPSYNLGVLYIISGDLSRRCYEHISENLTGYISSEDAYIGVIMSKLGVPPSTYSQFNLDGSALNQPHLYWEYPVIHNVSAKMMVDYWSSLEEIRSRDIDKLFNKNTDAEMTLLEDVFLAVVVTTPASHRRWRNNYRQVVKPVSIMKDNRINVVQFVCKTDNEV
ncbi:beta-1,3-galactosyltransferase 5-like, partial [Saccoglossus kowalevskii]|uniref:Hexosyltransferase n=1 Tax=Saccoglossus kowalevskii TaxID=10224 RepID=A0ABM0GZV0_SACKO